MSDIAAKLICPNCRHANTAIGASGSAICTDCAHMWNPADPTRPPEPVIPPFDMPSVEEVYGPPPADRITPAEWSPVDAVGGVAVLEGGQTATVVSFTEADSVIVRLDNDDLEEVPLADVERIMPPIEIPEPVEIPDTVDDLPPDMRLALELAALILRAGCESVEGTGENVTPGMPPVGYLPHDLELLPVIERAAGLAVGMIIEAYELDVDAMLEWVGAVDPAPETGQPTTEVGNDESSSADE